MDITPIKTHRDYRQILKESEGLMRAKRNTPAGDRLDVLVTLVESLGAEALSGLISPTRWKRSSITWTKMGFHLISFPEIA